VKLGFWEGSGSGILTGRGNSGPLFFLRRGRRKKVVVVETVCVVVVVAYKPWSPRLASDLEDSDSLESGRANEVLESSPYAGGAAKPLSLSGSSKVMRDSLALGFADVGPPVFWPESDALSDNDCCDGLDRRDLWGSGFL